MAELATFDDDVDFLTKHFEVDVLENAEGAKIACVAALQGRTMTSKSSGTSVHSNGFISRRAVERGLVDPQLNMCGGEDRIWISPEGGQFSVFFDPDVEMSFANWRTPKCIDTESFELVDRCDHSFTYQKDATLMNMSGFTFEFQLERRVELKNRADVEQGLGLVLPAVLDVVCHESSNKITNTGSHPWVAQTGLIGLWSICLNPPADDAVMIIPFKPGSEAELGPIVTADYFGELGPDRIAVSEKLNLVFLRGDGNFRSKLGISFARACSPIGGWNPTTQKLTIVEYNLPASAPDGYTNNLWEYQDQPFAGDVVNAYNDGPNDSGQSMGGFFELETVSPALALKPGESFTHSPRVTHLSGDLSALEKIAIAVFGVKLSQIESALRPLKS
jgi:hypothetical protein